MKQKDGYILQANIKSSCNRQDILFYRFRDSPFSFANSDKTKFTVSNICDCMIFFAGTLLFLELKSTKGKSKTFSEHDLKQLYNIDKIIRNKNNVKRFNVYGGFLIEFREVGECYYFSTDEILNYFKENNTKTLNILKYKKDYNCIKVDRDLLVKNYKYDIKKLMIELIKKI